jgi:hypothetical protein
LKKLRALRLVQLLKLATWGNFQDSNDLIETCTNNPTSEIQIATLLRSHPQNSTSIIIRPFGECNAKVVLELTDFIFLSLKGWYLC